MKETTGAPYNPSWSTAGKHNIRIPITMATNRIKLVIVPDVASGTDTLVVFGSENCVRGNR